ncbi:MAG: methylaspartate ammonia-lyase [Planctomycetota bacterium]|jgi:methylaspartate ammonia-lyase
MATITDVVFSAGTAGYFFDDQAAIRGGAARDGFVYGGEPSTPGFERVRVPAESVSITLLLENGSQARGDCCAVQYSGTAGRDPLFLAGDYLPWMEKSLKPLLAGREFGSFREEAKYFDGLRDEAGKPLHTAIRYGVTQALLSAVALGARRTVAEVVADEYGTETASAPVKIFAQSGDERRANAEKMILKSADVLPHGLFNNVPDKFGRRGEKFRDFVTWLRDRVLRLRLDESYVPEFHFDVYGTPGIAFEGDIARVAEYLAALEPAAAPFNIRVEAPVDMGSRDAQVEGMARIVEALRAMGSGVEVVADEWCNTLEDMELFAAEKAAHMLQVKMPDLGGVNNSVEAVLCCKRGGVKAYLGGSCTETDVSARISAHLALALQPHQVLAKPGMGVDEGFMIVGNEMRRTLALLRSRK